MTGVNSFIKKRALQRLFWLIFDIKQKRKVKTKTRNYREVTFQVGVDPIGQPIFRTHLVGLTDSIGFTRTFINGINHR